MSKSVRQRVSGPAIFQITQKTNRQILNVVFCLLYGIKVYEGLCRVLARPVTGINNRYVYGIRRKS